MPFDDNEFDMCVSFNGLHCLPDPAAAVREIVRCLRLTAASSATPSFAAPDGAKT